MSEGTEPIMPSETLINIQIVVGSFYTLTGIIAFILFLFYENSSAAAWSLISSFCSGGFTLFVFVLYRLFARPWEKIQETQVSLLQESEKPVVGTGAPSTNAVAVDVQEISTISNQELAQQHSNRLTLILITKYSAKLIAALSLAGSIAYLVFASYTEEQFTVKSHYVTVFWSVASLFWSLLLWFAAISYWRRYRSVYYELTNTKSSTESSFLLS